MTKSTPAAKAYWVVAYRDVRDPQELADYVRLAVPALEAAGGRPLSRDGTVEVHEAGIPARTVLIEFSSLDQARAAYRSASYQAALAALGDGAERDFRIIEGLAAS